MNKCIHISSHIIMNNSGRWGYIWTPYSQGSHIAWGDYRMWTGHLNSGGARYKQNEYMMLDNRVNVWLGLEPVLMILGLEIVHLTHRQTQIRHLAQWYTAQLGYEARGFSGFDFFVITMTSQLISCFTKNLTCTNWACIAMGTLLAWHLNDSNPWSRNKSMR